MIVKSKNVQTSRVNPQKATSALKSHLKYLQYRERNPEQETKADRHFFNDTYDHIDRRWVAKDLMNEPVGNIYYHRIILSPAHDEPISDWRKWTREVMSDLENRFSQDLNWYAVHHANTDDPHVHVVLQGTGSDRETGQAAPVRFTPQDFQSMRESGRAHSDHEHYHLIEETLQNLEERDILTQETPEHAWGYVRER